MMKKTYLLPKTKVKHLSLPLMFTASTQQYPNVTQSKIVRGPKDNPSTSYYSVWEEND